MLKFKLTCEVNGKTIDDVVIALEVLTKQIESGFTLASDKNESGNYSYILNEENEKVSDKS